MSSRVAVLSERQTYALCHPVDRSDGASFRPPAPKSSRLHAPWVSSLEVTREPDGQWYWRASVARVHVTVQQWDAAWHMEAGKILDELLAGVGEDEIPSPPEPAALGRMRRRRLSLDEVTFVRRSVARRPPS